MFGLVVNAMAQVIYDNKKVQNYSFALAKLKLEVIDGDGQGFDGMAALVADGNTSAIDAKMCNDIWAAYDRNSKGGCSRCLASPLA